MNDILESSLVIEPDPILHQPSSEVKNIGEDTIMIVNHMTHTMQKNQGIGLAAVQIGILKRIIVVCNEESRKNMIMINPCIISVSEELNSFKEGCLSIPTINIEISRPKEIELSYFDIYGNEHKDFFDNLNATCIQHEIDHLNGKLIIDSLSSIRKRMIISKLRKIKKLMFINKKKNDNK